MIELSELIEDLRRELSSAMRAAPSDGLRFAFDSIDVGLELAVEKSGTGRGGVKFWVLGLGGGEPGKRLHAAAQAFVAAAGRRGRESALCRRRSRAAEIVSAVPAPQSHTWSFLSRLQLYPE